MAAASAQATPSKLLFEEHPAITSAAGSSEAAAVLGELRQRLRTQDVLVDPRAIVELPNELLPLPGRWDPGLSLAQLTTQLDDAVRTYLRGQFQLAEAQLEAALALAHRNPALVVSDAGSRLWMTQALGSLALARLRQGDRAGAHAAVAEQVRSYPELPISLDEFGTRGERLYAEVRRALEAGPRGSLLVDVSDPDARIYLNESGRGRGGAFTSDLLPGGYRVLVMVGGESRLYRVAVHEHEQTRLSIDWAVDSSFTASPEWIGLRAPPAGRARAHRQLARRLAFNDAIVIGVVERRGAPLLWGAVYERGSGRELRRGAAAATRLGPFAEFLAAGRHAGEFASAEALRAAALDDPAPGPALTPASAPSPAGPAWPRWALAGAGATALAGATYLTISAARGDCAECHPAARASTWAIALAGLGAMSLGVATLLSFEARRSYFPGSAALGLQPLRRGGLATLGWQF